MTASIRPLRLIPFECDAGASTLGAAAGPRALYESGVVQNLKFSGRDIDWFTVPQGAPKTDLPPLGSMARADIVHRACLSLCDQVAQVAASGSCPVTIGGDHSLAIGSAAGAAKGRQSQGRMGMIWIDAHPDSHTAQTSFTKSLHGMPIATLLGFGDERFTKLSSAAPVLKAENIFQIGLRSIDEPELRFIARQNISIATNGDIGQQGLQAALESAVRVATKGTDCVYLSIDLDACDPSVAPGIGSPVPGGLMREELLSGLSWLARTVDLAGVDIAEFNPRFEKDNKTARLIGEILVALAA